MIEALVWKLVGLASRRGWRRVYRIATAWYERRHPLWHRCLSPGCSVMMWPADRCPARCPMHNNVN